MDRRAQRRRDTSETRIRVDITLDGQGNADIDTGIGFFDHMLAAFARHGLFELTVNVEEGDLHVDAHHTIEDTGIVLGEAFREALGGKKGIRRFGWCLLPMDDALVRVALDLSGRPYLVYHVHPQSEQVGGVHVRLFREFFQAFVTSAGINLHVSLLAGEEVHHIFEAVFKAVGKAADQAVTHDPRIDVVPSTKGNLA